MADLEVALGEDSVLVVATGVAELILLAHLAELFLEMLVLLGFGMYVPVALQVCWQGASVSSESHFLPGHVRCDVTFPKEPWQGDIQTASRTFQCIHS